MMPLLRSATSLKFDSPWAMLGNLLKLGPPGFVTGCYSSVPKARVEQE